MNDEGGYESRRKKAFSFSFSRLLFHALGGKKMTRCFASTPRNASPPARLPSPYHLARGWNSGAECTWATRRTDTGGQLCPHVEPRDLWASVSFSDKYTWLPWRSAKPPSSQGPPTSSSPAVQRALDGRRVLRGPRGSSPSFWGQLSASHRPAKQMSVVTMRGPTKGS